MRTLAVRKSMNAAYSLAHNTHLMETAKHNIVIRTTAALRAAPLSARPAIQITLTQQTAAWRAWVLLYNRQLATYLDLVRLNAAAEADFRAKSARALATANAVPARPACPPSNPYAGAARYRVMSYPGMSITRYAKTGRNPLWVTTANLNAPGAKTTVGPLTGSYVASRTQLTSQITGSGALAGVNGDFYYLGRDSSPWGAVIRRGGRIDKSTTNLGQKTFFVQSNGLAKIGYVDVRPVLRAGTRTVRANSLNSHHLPINGIAVFTPLWGPASRSDLKPRQSVREYLVNSRGVIAAIRPGLTKAGIPRGGLVIVAQGTAILRLQAAGFGLGRRVSQTSSATSNAGGGVYSAIGVGRQVLQNGQFSYLNCIADRAVARTAIGIKPGGREIVLVTVRGQTDSATSKFSGMTVRDMAAFMKSLGANNAAMFDGGGSTILMAKIGPGYQKFLGAPQYIRPVSNSFGIWRG